MDNELDEPADWDRADHKAQRERRSLFRQLSAEEAADFRKWARDNYRAFSPINGVWHTVIQDECRKINEEAEPF
jgi:hypothetical protein